VLKQNTNLRILKKRHIEGKGASYGSGVAHRVRGHKRIECVSAGRGGGSEGKMEETWADSSSPGLTGIRVLPMSR